MNLGDAFNEQWYVAIGKLIAGDDMKLMTAQRDYSKRTVLFAFEVNDHSHRFSEIDESRLAEIALSPEQAAIQHDIILKGSDD